MSDSWVNDRGGQTADSTIAGSVASTADSPGATEQVVKASKRGRAGPMPPHKFNAAVAKAMQDVTATIDRLNVVSDQQCHASIYVTCVLDTVSKGSLKKAKVWRFGSKHMTVQRLHDEGDQQGRPPQALPQDSPCN
jgi:hypothetical protein